MTGEKTGEAGRQSYRNLLVVARFQEDLGWTDKVPEGWETVIVQKDKDLPNTGREPASFLWWIHKEYPKIKESDTLAFVQGDPLAHCRDLYDKLRQPFKGFKHLAPDGEPMYSYGDGNPHHAGVPVAEFYKRFTGKELEGGVAFYPGGQFITTGERIKKRPRKFYKDLLGDMKDNNPWAMERLWGTLFGA